MNKNSAEIEIGFKHNARILFFSLKSIQNVLLTKYYYFLIFAIVEEDSKQQ